MTGGKEFQSWGAAQQNVWLPMVTRRAEGTIRCIEEDRREQEGVAM